MLRDFKLSQEQAVPSTDPWAAVDNRREGQCHGPGCASHTLIKAHIMPAAFARVMHRQGGFNVGLSDAGGRRAQYQLGRFDKAILCGDCDRRLGQLDNFAFTFCNGSLPHARMGAIGLIPDVDCDRLAAFAISVIWRASISTDSSFDQVDLGPLSDRARDNAFGVDTPTFPVIANRLTSPRYDVRKFYVEPTRRRLGVANAYSFQLGGFQWFVLADSRPVPRKLRALVINGKNDLLSLAVPLERTTEFLGMLEIADRSRPRPAAG